MYYATVIIISCSRVSLQALPLSSAAELFVLLIQILSRLAVIRFRLSVLLICKISYLPTSYILTDSRLRFRRFLDTFAVPFQTSFSLLYKAPSFLQCINQILTQDIIEKGVLQLITLEQQCGLRLIGYYKQRSFS